jgi:hypothetical protein
MFIRFYVLAKLSTHRNRTLQGTILLRNASFHEKETPPPHTHTYLLFDINGLVLLSDSRVFVSMKVNYML